MLVISAPSDPPVSVAHLTTFDQKVPLFLFDSKNPGARRIGDRFAPVRPDPMPGVTPVVCGLVF